MVIITPEDRAATPLYPASSVTQFHQDFFLGPANQVLGGGAMLVDTVSQYGVGSIYAIAAWFQLVPVGNYTLGLFDGVLTALVFVGGYLVLRMAGASRPIAATALGVAVVSLIYGLLYPIGALLQHGGLRFGLPMALIVAAVAASRWPERERLARAAQLAVVAISSIWALEAFGYVLLTFAGLELFRLWLLPGSRRRGRLLRTLAQLLGAVAVAHLLLAALTLAASGELPAWVSTSSTCAPSCSAGWDCSPTTSLPGRRGSPPEPSTWPRSPRSSCSCAPGPRSRGGSRRRCSPSAGPPPTASACSATS